MDNNLFRGQLCVTIRNGQGRKLTKIFDTKEKELPFWKIAGAVLSRNFSENQVELIEGGHRQFGGFEVIIMQVAM